MATFDAEKYYPLVKDLQIAFRKPATTEVRAEASKPDDEIARLTAAAAADGKAEFTLRATVTDTAGVVVAETTGLYQLRTHSK